MLSSSEKELGRKAEISIKLSEFEIPPIQDVLVVGRKAPIGPGAVRRMVDALSPDQYEIIPIDKGAVEAMVVRKSLLKLLSLEKLIDIILEESLKVADESSVIKAQVDVTVAIKRVIEL
ncbi:MAG: hypothetical protein JG764_1092 [Clostridiales bacterium]|jgi:hypothetical protein|nr:hypothetical protein [Clostridiales bacterium]